jgi:acetyl-CoA carboxylase biotin carboxylase subunit
MGTTRQNAIDRMRRALGEYIIRGPKTTIALHDAIMRDPVFVRGKYDTSFVGKFLEGGVSTAQGEVTPTRRAPR